MAPAGSILEDTRNGAEAPADEELVRRVAAGSETALAALYDRHSVSIFRAALLLNPDRGIAEEVVQDTFLALWNRAERFDPAVGSLGAWLSTIARNRAVDRLRTATRRLRAAPFSAFAADHPDQGATVDWLVASGSMVASGAPEAAPEVALAARESGETIASALTVLTDTEREAILLAYRDGLSQSEIAAHLGWPLGTVKTRSRRALHRLREALEPAAMSAAPSAKAARATRESSSRNAEPCGAPCA